MHVCKKHVLDVKPTHDTVDISIVLHYDVMYVSSVQSLLFLTGAYR